MAVSGWLHPRVASQCVLCFDSHSFTLLFAVSIIRAIGQAPITAVIFGMYPQIMRDLAAHKAKN